MPQESGAHGPCVQGNCDHRAHVRHGRVASGPVLIGRTRRAVLVLPVAFALALCPSVEAALPAHGHSPVKTRKPTFAPALSTSAFGLDLMRHMGSGNLVLSPDSISTALAMAGTGARGQTAAQMAGALRLTSPSAFAQIGELQSAIAAEQQAAAHGDPEAPTLDLADTLFLQKGPAFGAPFLAGLKQHFGASPQLLDFEHDSGEAVRSIDSWVSEHTQGLIPQILSSLPVTTRLVLANAIYLKAAWAKQFATQETRPAEFHRPSGEVSTLFMHETTGLPYTGGHGYQALALPYRSSTLSLLVMLPVGQSVAHLLGQLSPARLSEIEARLQPRRVALSLPRFHIGLDVELNGPLQALGMTDAFQESAANFSAIGAERGLHIGVVKHAADFTVEEAGTVAAAATTVSIEATDAPRFVQPPVAFDADLPFLFFLRDDRTGALLFAGRLEDPAAGSG